MTRRLGHHAFGLGHHAFVKFLKLSTDRHNYCRLIELPVGLSSPREIMSKIFI
jgi:hypothetical protein